MNSVTLLPHKASPRRIVIVEDSDAVRQSLALLLRTRGYAVDVFRSGMEVLSQRAIATADCFLIDYVLPKMDGMTLLQRLRERGVDAPCLLITGYHSSDLVARASAAGFVGVVEKPPQGESLMREVEAAIGA